MKPAGHGRWDDSFSYRYDMPKLFLYGNKLFPATSMIIFLDCEQSPHGNKELFPVTIEYIYSLKQQPL